MKVLYWTIVLVAGVGTCLAYWEASFLAKAAYLYCVIHWADDVCAAIAAQRRRAE